MGKLDESKKLNLVRVGLGNINRNPFINWTGLVRISSVMMQCKPSPNTIRPMNVHPHFLAFNWALTLEYLSLVITAYNKLLTKIRKKMFTSKNQGTFTI